MSAAEPTLAGVLAEIREMRTQLNDRISLMSDRISLMNDRLDQIARDQNTVIEEVAALRREYNFHDHPHTHGDDGREQAA